MPFPLILVAAGAVGLIRGLLGQRSANKQADAAYREAVRQSQDQYARQKANFENTRQRRTSTLNFAKAVAQAQGYGIPESVFDFLIKGEQGTGFPSYSTPTPGYKPNSLVSGLVGGAGDFLQSYQMQPQQPKKKKLPTPIYT